MDNTHTTHTNNVFSPGRCGRYLALTWRQEGRTLSLSALLIFVLTVALYLFRAYNTDNYTSRVYPYDPMWEGNIMNFMLILYPLSTLAASMFFTAFNGKSRRLTTLTLPVSAFEKFLVWFLIYFVGFFVFMFVQEMVADAIRVGFVRAYYDVGDKASILPLGQLLTFRPFDLSEEMNSEAAYLVMTVYGTLLGLYTVFMLGSIFAPKRSWLKTAVFLWLYSMVIGWAFFGGLMLFVGSGSFDIPIESELTSDKVLIYLALEIAGTAAMFWLAYARMRETDSVIRW